VDPEEEPSYEDRAEAGSSGDGGASHDAAAMGDGTNRTSSSADGNAAATTKQRPRLDDTSLNSHLSSVRAVKSGDDQ